MSSISEECAKFVLDQSTLFLGKDSPKLCLPSSEWGPISYEPLYWIPVPYINQYGYSQYQWVRVRLTKFGQYELA